MIMSLLWTLTAHARTVGVVVGAREFWTSECSLGEARAACIDADQELRYADDDAWRAAWFLQTVTDPDSLRVLTEPDDSTGGRSFPGGAPNSPTQDHLLAAVRELRGDPQRGAVTVVLFIAAHGSPGEVHLADGRHDFQQLRQSVLGVLGPQDELVLIADACNSARWRSGEDYAVKPLPYFPPVQPSNGRQVEALVDGQTPEDDDILGGVFTYLTLSAWMGAGDSNEDGDVSTQELQDQLFRYAAAGTRAPFAPVVRSPHGNSNYPLPERPHGGTITVGAEGPARWLVLAQGEGIEAPGVAIGEVFTTAGQPGQMTVPEGAYTVVELPCSWDPARRAYTLAGDDAVMYDVVVRGGESSELDVAGTPVQLNRGRGLGQLGQTVDNLPVMALEALPASRARYHGGSRWWLGVSADVASPALFTAGRDAPLLGGGLSLRHPLVSGRLQLTSRVGGLAEVGGTEPSALWLTATGADLEVLTFSRPHVYAGPVGGAQVALGRLTTMGPSPTYSAVYLAPGAQAGARLAFVQGRSTWSSTLLWTPGWVRVDEGDAQDGELERWRSEPVQIRLTASGEITW